MKVLVATSQGQGRAPGDYCWTTEGELVQLYDCPASCRCSAFSGVESHRATTTAMVVDRPDLEPVVLSHVFRRDLVNQGYAQYLDEVTVRTAVAVDLLAIMTLVYDLEPGTVVERHGAGARVRRLRAA